MPKTEKPAPATLEEAAAEVAASRVETITIQELLEVPLSDGDYRHYGILAGQASSEIAVAESQLKALKSQFASRIDAAASKRDEYLAIFNAKSEFKNVDCWLTKDWGAGTITV